MRTWKQKLIDVVDLKKAAAGLVFDRMTILLDVFQDEEFRAENDFDDLAAARCLDAYVNDLAADFMELRAVMKEFPKREQWTNRDLKKMLADVLAAEDERARESRKKGPQRKRYTSEDFRQLEKKCADLTAKVDELAEENRQLHDDLAVERYKNKELEAMLQKQSPRKQKTDK